VNVKVSRYFFAHKSTTMKTTISILLAVLFFISCNSISEKDLTVIDGIKLGQSENEFENHLDSLGLKRKEFTKYDPITKLLGQKTKALLYSSYVTNVFTNTQYNSSFADHQGIIWAQKTTSNNVIGVVIPLTHFINEGGPMQYVQSVAVGFIENIKEMLIKKYGTPIDTITRYNSLPVISETEGINWITIEKSKTIKSINWQTKAIDIQLVYGLSDPVYYYDKNWKRYVLSFNLNRDVESGGESCYRNAYLSYRVKDEVQEKLELNKPRL
jgi:hypothetical protein